APGAGWRGPGTRCTRRPGPGSTGPPCSCGAPEDVDLDPGVPQQVDHGAAALDLGGQRVELLRGRGGGDAHVQLHGGEVGAHSGDPGDPVAILLGDRVGHHVVDGDAEVGGDEVDEHGDAPVQGTHHVLERGRRGVGAAGGDGFVQGEAMAAEGD